MTRSPREQAAQTMKIQREQERLFQDLLGVLDDLDHACDHWQQAEEDHIKKAVPSMPPSVAKTTSPRSNRLQQWGQYLQKWIGQSPQSEPEAEPLSDAMTEVLTSAHEGVEMIRRSLLEMLQKRQVVPIHVLGQPFDPEQMYALGRQESEVAEENTILKEVVRGYQWQDRILREAKVIVAVKPAAEPKQAN